MGHGRLLLAGALLAGAAGALPAPVRAAPGDDPAGDVEDASGAQGAGEVAGPPQEDVDAAVARGVARLREEQDRDGSFGTMPGETALALLALRHSEVPADDPVCRDAASNLERSLPDGTVYGASLGIVALLVQDPELHSDKIEELVGDVVDAQCENGQWTYAYRRTARKPAGDNSNTQFAALALGVARARGVEVPVDPFRRCREFFVRTQNADGGWGYSDKERSASYASMTAGGAMVLAFCAAAGSGVQVTHASIAEDASVRKALTWLGERFDPAANTGAGAAFGKRKRRSDSFWKHYWLWSVERACAVTGSDRLGGHDWYAEGARHLLDTQLDDGAWRSPETDLRATCFALLFFGRSTRRAITPRGPRGPTTPSSRDEPAAPPPGGRSGPEDG